MKPKLIWVFEVISKPLMFTRVEHVCADVDADHDKLVSDLSDAGYTAIRLDHKEWPASTDLGGYPLVYVCADGSELCPKCANDNIKLTANPRAERDWRIVAVDINYEDDSLNCDHCGGIIKPAYGD